MNKSRKILGFGMLLMYMMVLLHNIVPHSHALGAADNQAEVAHTNAHDHHHGHHHDHGHHHHHAPKEHSSEKHSENGLWHSFGHLFDGFHNHHNGVHLDFIPVDTQKLRSTQLVIHVVWEPEIRLSDANGPMHIPANQVPAYAYSDGAPPPLRGPPTLS